MTVFVTMHDGKCYISLNIKRKYIKVNKLNYIYDNNLIYFFLFNL